MDTKQQKFKDDVKGLLERENDERERIRNAKNTFFSGVQGSPGAAVPQDPITGLGHRSPSEVGIVRGSSPPSRASVASLHDLSPPTLPCTKSLIFQSPEPSPSRDLIKESVGGGTKAPPPRGQAAPTSTATQRGGDGRGVNYAGPRATGGGRGGGGKVPLRTAAVAGFSADMNWESSFLLAPVQAVAEYNQSNEMMDGGASGPVAKWDELHCPPLVMHPLATGKVVSQTVVGSPVSHKQWSEGVGQGGGVKMSKSNAVLALVAQADALMPPTSPDGGQQQQQPQEQNLLTIDDSVSSGNISGRSSPQQQDSSSPSQQPSSRTDEQSNNITPSETPPKGETRKASNRKSSMFHLMPEDLAHSKHMAQLRSLRQDMGAQLGELDPSRNTEGGDDFGDVDDGSGLEKLLEADKIYSQYVHSKV